ncbi:penicillin-binding protein 1A [Aliiroseovarius sp. YM-037]|uniref:penicillin-binding protein 1A n=1 Tax=Aliiroseovarius sp. YM-037 TaxID=3341728 RepID=UPI003A80B71F
MIRFILSFIGAIFSLLTIGAIITVLGIGAVFWMYGRDLPNHEQLSQYTPPTISRIYSGEGRIIDEFAQERRLFAESEEIPDLVKHAFISAEDKNFYTHRGYDPMGMVAAAIDAAQGARLRGASTITQQVMKNFLLGGERSVERKIKELILASRIEDTLSKDQILELYLNEIFLGQNSFGVAAAAQTYFNKTLGELEPHEAAYLAALPKAPSSYHPVRAVDRAIDRRNFVLREMEENGYLSEEEYQSAREEPLLTVQNGDYPAFRNSLPPRDYFTDEIRRQLSRDFGEGEFFTAGYTVRATVDPELQPVAATSLQRALEDYDRGQGVWRGTGKTISEESLGDEVSWRAALAAVKVARDVEGWYPAVVLEIGETHARIGIEGVEEDEDGHWIPPEDVKWARKRLEDGGLSNRASRAGDLVEVGDVVHVRAMTKDDDGSFIRWTLRQVPEVQGGFVAMDVNTGRVISMQGGFSYQHSVFNRATQAARQPGSSFKPFVYAAALDSGFTPATIVVDAPIEVETGAGIWRPQNASRQFYGPTPLRTGIERSRNLMTVRLAQEIGMDTVASYAEHFGVYDRMGQFLANSLGSEETTLYKMVAAYAMFANGGERIEPSLVDRVQDRWGETIYRHDQRTCTDCDEDALPSGLGPRITSDRERVIDAITAYQLTSMLRGVVQRGTAAGRVNLNVPVAGKTGTTNDAKDVWFIGFTSNIVAGCYIGYDRPRSLGNGVFGGNTCGPVFNRFMQQATAKYGGGEFDVPPGGRFIKIDRFSGARLPDGAAGEYVVAEYFREGEEPVFGIAGMIDGGFAMGANLPLFAPGEGDDLGQGRTVTTSSGGTARVGQRATFGSVSSGGLY